MIRKVLVVLMVVPYVGLCLYDLIHGRPRTGVAAGLLAAVNFILYWG
jgi:hypothetical protein